MEVFSMLRKLFNFLLVISLLLTVSGCDQLNTGDNNNDSVKGVESSVSETGQIKRVKITADNVAVKQGLTPESPTLQTSNKNATYNVVNQVNKDWYAVQMPDNSIGFVSSSQCTPIIAQDQQAPGTGGANAAPGTAPNDQGTPAPGDTNQTKPGDGGGNDGAKTPDANTDNNTLTDQENQMLELVNQARSQNGLQPLKIDMELTNVARIKSQDMIDNNYFSHNSPTYGSPFDMMKDFGINYVKAAENIAGNQDSTRAHDALMNSPGHRKNILDPDFTHIGIGIQQGGQYGSMFTQMFVSKPQ